MHDILALTKLLFFVCFFLNVSYFLLHVLKATEELTASE